MLVIIVKRQLAADPFFQQHRRCLIPVEIQGENGSQYFDLLLDTGAKLTLLSPCIHKAIGVQGVALNERPTVKVTTPHGNLYFYKGTVKRLNIGEISLADEEVRVGTLPEKFQEMRIVGLLGTNALRKLRLKIDYLEQTLQISQILSE